MTDFVTQLTRNRIEFTVLTGAIALAALAPFGGASTEPLFFLIHRIGMMALILLSLWTLTGRTAPDFSAGAYVLGGIFLALMGISVWASPGLNASGEAIWFEHLWFGLFFVVLARFARTCSAQWRTALLTGIAGVAGIHLAIGLASGGGRVDNLFGNANHLAAFFLPALGISLAGVVAGGNLRWRLAAGVSALGLFYGITLTLSRGAVLAALGMVALAVLTSGRRKVMAFAGALGLVAAIGIAAANPALVARFTDRGDVDPYNYQRAAIWRSTAEIMADHPVLGVGPGRYDEVARRYRPAVEGGIARYMKRQAIAHNEYLHYAAEAGIPAAVVLLILIGCGITSLWKGRTVHDRAAVLAVAGVGAHGLVDNVFTVPVLVATFLTVATAPALLTDERKVPALGAGWPRVFAATALATLVLMSTLAPALAFELNRLGLRALGEGNTQRAIQLHRFALAARSSEASLMSNLGTALFAEFRESGDLHTLDMAEAYFRRASEASPDLLEPRLQAVVALVARLEGDPLADRPAHAEIARAGSEALRVDPFMPMVRKNLAESLYQTGRHEDAMRELETALGTEPHFVPGYLRLAEWLETDGNAVEALRLRSEAAAIAARFAGESNLTDYERMLLGLPAGAPETAEFGP